MNIDPSSIKILAFGDSNTWGRIPGNENGARYDVTKRWTGVLQSLLGDRFEVVEESLNGRTTDLESPEKAGKNGVTYLFSCLESQKPIDLIILSLGKNDLKVKYNRSPIQVGDGIRQCFEVIKKEGKDRSGYIPKVILVSPAIIKEKERVRGGQLVIDFKGANLKSKELSDIYLKIANEFGATFVDLSKIVVASEIDGIHLDENQHKNVAEYLASVIVDLTK